VTGKKAHILYPFNRLAFAKFFQDHSP